MSSSSSENAQGGERASGHPLSGKFGVFLFVVLLGVAAWLTYRTLTTAPVPQVVGVATVYVCSESNKPFDYTMEEGEEYPVTSPYSKKKTGYPAEPCFWTRDNKQKSKPTWVILNTRLDKSGDTICPDCGRVVVGHNPRPGPEIPMAAGQ